MSWSRRRQSVRTQLVWWNILALALLLGALGGVVRYLVGSTIMNSVDQDLDRRTHVGGGGPPPGTGPPRDGQPHFDHPHFGLSDFDRPRFGQPPGNFPPPHPPDEGHPGERGGAHDPYRPRRFDLSGHEQGPFGAQESLWDQRTFALAKAGQTVYSTITVNDEPVRVLSRPFPPHGPIQGVVQAAYPLTDVRRAMAGLDRALLTLLPVALLCAGLGGAWLTDRVLRRVRRLTQAAGGIGARDLSERLPVTGRDEFSELAETFNGLLDRLETAFAQQQRLFEQQRRFTADASHELKTPLTIIQGNTSLALSGHPDEADYHQSMQEIGMAAETMSRLVRDLILLAQSDAGCLGRNPIELLARDFLEVAISRAPRAGAPPIRLTITDEMLSVTGNEEELVRLFTNLLTNAVHHTPPEGKITVAARREGDTAVITVTDTGDGIAPEHLPHLGERFYRVDSARSRTDGGTGLGLSISRSIVEAHAGTMTFESTLGKGTTVTVTLPGA